jgi:hypothetical protein
VFCAYPSRSRGAALKAKDFERAAAMASATPQHPAENPVPALLDVHPRDRARDDQLLDLGRALEDVVDQLEMAL